MTTQIVEPPFDVFAALRERYPLGEYAYLSEVRNSTGFSRKARYADALVMSTWPSRGLELMGFEVKVSRADWLRELKDPAKAEVIFSYCDRWYLVVSDPDIVKESELPKPWGLLVPRGKKLVVKVEAPKLSPKPMDRHFLASLMRNVTENCVPTRDIDARLREQYKKGYDAAIETADTRTKALQNGYDRLTRSIADFEKKAGIKIDDWRIGQIDKVMEFVRSGTPDCMLHQLRNLAMQAESLSRVANQHLKVAEEYKHGMRENDQQEQEQERRGVDGTEGISEGQSAQ